MSGAARFGRGAARVFFGSCAAGWLGPVIARASGGIAVVLAVSLLAVVLGLATPWLTKQFIDEGLVARDAQAVWTWALAAFGVGLAALGMGVVNALLHLRFSARMLADLRGRAMRASLLRDPLAPPKPVGEMAARIDGDTAEIQRFAFDGLLAAFGSILRLMGGGAMLMVLDWRLALIPILAAPLELGFLVWARGRTTARAEDVREMRGAVSSFVIESLSSLPTLRALGAGGARAGALEPLQTSQIAALERQRRWLELVGAVPQVIAAAVRLSVLLIGGLWVVQGDWQIGALIAFLAYIGMLTGPLRNLLGLYHAQAQALVSAGRLADLMEDGAEEASGRALPQGAALGFEAARAAMADHAPVTTTIPAGARVLIDGASGAGKSSLMHLALRLAAPAPGGRVTLDGLDVRALDPVALRRAVALVPQRGTLLAMSLADNLRLADPGALDARLWDVLEQADLADWVRAQGAGLDLMLTETGANLSGGERQRIALARALLLPFRVLILDESLSEVDAASAGRILATLDARYADRTRIFIAHAGPAREGRFDQRITLSSRPPERRNSRGDSPNQRENARENAVWSE
ncbi:ABC transporter ATP-binding protein [Rhodovulum strictum]|uniref:ATP-binding cassette domain-containing protein n=1 Tax=Rhodovulum strictum TaxID=58314 RepID=A0A844BMU4_9RHOB|nr:ABC transporter ATP-binding protein [Rhodovulum strictum]MRH22263.1 ATP-binding cassette domain-containing protein [Rhodovulum strictum]